MSKLMRPTSLAQCIPLLSRTHTSPPYTLKCSGLRFALRSSSSSLGPRLHHVINYETYITCPRLTTSPTHTQHLPRTHSIVQGLRSALRSASSSLGPRLQQVTQDTPLSAALESIVGRSKVGKEVAASSLPSAPASLTPLLARLDTYQVQNVPQSAKHPAECKTSRRVQHIPQSAKHPAECKTSCRVQWCVECSVKAHLP